MNKQAIFEQGIFSLSSFLIFTVSAKLLEGNQLYLMVIFSLVYGFAANIQSALLLDPISINYNVKTVDAFRQANTIVALIISLLASYVVSVIVMDFNIIALLGMFLAMISGFERRVWLIREEYFFSLFVSVGALLLSFLGLIAASFNLFEDPLIILILSYIPASIFYISNLKLKLEPLPSFRDGLKLLPASVIGAASSQIMTLGGVLVGRDIANETRILSYFFNPIFQAANAINIRMLSNLKSEATAKAKPGHAALVLAVSISVSSFMSIIYGIYAEFDHLYLIFLVAIDTAAAVIINLIGAKLKYEKKFRILLQYNIYQMLLFVLCYFFVKDNFMIFIALSRVAVSLLQLENYRRSK